MGDHNRPLSINHWNEEHRIVPHISVFVPTLRIGRVWDDRVRLDEAVNVRRMMPKIYTRIFTVPSDVIDVNGHVNNVVYVQWMQDIAVEHYSALGGVAAQGEEATWFVREHRIEYLLPAFAGEEIEIRTWVENIRRVRSLRKYEFVRRADGRMLVRGETDWVYVNARTGRPCAVPAWMFELFSLSNKTG